MSNQAEDFFVLSQSNHKTGVGLRVLFYIPAR